MFDVYYQCVFKQISNKTSHTGSENLHSENILWKNHLSDYKIEKVKQNCKKLWHFPNSVHPLLVLAHLHHSLAYPYVFITHPLYLLEHHLHFVVHSPITIVHPPNTLSHSSYYVAHPTNPVVHSSLFVAHSSHYTAHPDYLLVHLCNILVHLDFILLHPKNPKPKRKIRLLSDN